MVLNALLLHGVEYSAETCLSSCAFFLLLRCINQKPPFPTGKNGLTKSSAPSARRAASNSSSCTPKTDVWDSPAPGKYSASMPHLDIYLVSFQFSRKGILRSTRLRKHSLIEIPPYVVRRTQRGHTNTAMSVRFLLHKSGPFKAIVCFSRWH